jgi:hypothetical protein
MAPIAPPGQTIKSKGNIKPRSRALEDSLRRAPYARPWAPACDPGYRATLNGGGG